MSQKREALVLILATALIAVFGCFAADDKKDEKPANDPQFHKVLQAVAREYFAYGIVDDSNRWAPELCAIKPGKLHPSASTDAETHGGKLYYIYAMDAQGYLQTTKEDWHRKHRELKPISGTEKAKQVLVKQSWKAVKADDPKHTVESYDRTRFAARKGELYKTGEQSDLFIMIQFDKDTPGTDEGWIYGTVAKDGSTVSSSGKVQNCMNCHVDAPRHRVFGLQEISPRIKGKAKE